MEPDLDREDYRLRVLIEQMQHEGRSEHEIERAICEASSRSRREQQRESRSGGRFGLFARLLT